MEKIFCTPLNVSLCTCIYLEQHAIVTFVTAVFLFLQICHRGGGYSKNMYHELPKVNLGPP